MTEAPSAEPTLVDVLLHRHKGGGATRFVRPSVAAAVAADLARVDWTDEQPIDAPHTWLYYWEPWHNSPIGANATRRDAYLTGHWAGIWQWDWDDYPSRPAPSPGHLRLQHETVLADLASWLSEDVVTTDAEDVQVLRAFAAGYIAGCQRREETP